MLSLDAETRDALGFGDAWEVPFWSLARASVRRTTGREALVSRTEQRRRWFAKLAPAQLAKRNATKRRASMTPEQIDKERARDRERKRRRAA